LSFVYLLANKNMIFVSMSFSFLNKRNRIHSQYHRVIFYLIILALLYKNWNLLINNPCKNWVRRGKEHWPPGFSMTLWSVKIINSDARNCSAAACKFLGGRCIVDDVLHTFFYKKSSWAAHMSSFFFYIYIIIFSFFF
jgi:hypothetical protein